MSEPDGLAEDVRKEAEDFRVDSGKITEAQSALYSSIKAVFLDEKRDVQIYTSATDQIATDELFQKLQGLKDSGGIDKRSRDMVKSALQAELIRISKESSDRFYKVKLNFPEIVRLIKEVDCAQELFFIGENGDTEDKKDIEDGFGQLLWNELNSQIFSDSLRPGPIPGQVSVNSVEEKSEKFIQDFQYLQERGYTFNPRLPIHTSFNSREDDKDISRLMNEGFSDSFVKAYSDTLIHSNTRYSVSVDTKSQYIEGVLQPQLNVMDALGVNPEFTRGDSYSARYVDRYSVLSKVWDKEHTQLLMSKEDLNEEIVRILLVEKFGLSDTFYKKVEGLSDTRQVCDYDWLMSVVSTQPSDKHNANHLLQKIGAIMEQFQVDNPNSIVKFEKAATIRIIQDLNLLAVGGFSSTVKDIREINILKDKVDSIITSPESQSAFLEAYKKYLATHGVNHISSGTSDSYVEFYLQKDLIQLFNVSEKIGDTITDLIVDQLIGGKNRYDHLSKLAELFNIDLHGGRIQQAVLAEVQRRMSSDFYYHDVVMLCASFDVPKNIKKQVAVQSFLKIQSDQKIYPATVFQDFGLEGKNITIEELAKNSRLVQSLYDDWQIKDFNALSNFVHKYYDLWQLASTTFEEPLALRQHELEAVKALHLTLKEAELIKRNGVDILNLQAELFDAEGLAKTDKDLGDLKRNEIYKSMYEKLKEADADWQDEQNISEPFERAIKVFGYEKIFSYMDREGLSRHDAIHAFDDILKFYELVKADMTPNQFYGTILNQVRIDDKSYNEGSAQHHLNSIVLTLNVDIEGTLVKLKKYEHIDQFKDLIELFDSPKVIFSSWNNLKRYSELTQLLERTEILDQLLELKNAGKEKMYQYVSQLAFHPSSKVDMQKVLEFWRQPTTFLAGEATHTPVEVHDRKKPSNYLDIPHLDLTADELRDSLVEGSLDRIQVFTPMEATYDYVLIDGNVYGSQLDLVKASLGSRKEGVAGKAKDSQKLFGEINKILKSKGFSMQEYLAGSIAIDEDIKAQVEGLVFNEQYGIPKNAYERQKIVAKINRKSDPEGVLAGNDTACCMPFGDGKNTVYMFNPNAAHFTVQLVRDDGSMRTIAQSVLTKDLDIQAKVPNVIETLNKEGSHMYQVLPDQLLSQKESRIVSCDNIEVAQNYREGDYAHFILSTYKDFFAEYTRRFGEKQNLSQERVVIGREEYDASFKPFLTAHLPLAPNTYAPQAPVSYSDKTGSDVYYIDVQNIKRLDRKKVKIDETIGNTKSAPPNIKGVHPLTFEDAVAVAYIEGKSYADNISLVQYLHNMENGLIAKDINNVAKGRSNMSFKYVDDKGKMRGYMLAYEGKIKAPNDDYYEDIGDESVLYISDLASDRESMTAGGRLIQAFVDAYRQNYLEKSNLLPIYMEAREQTSYAIVKKQLDKISKDLGIQFELDERGSGQAGEDTMHYIMIRPVRKGDRIGDMRSVEGVKTKEPEKKKSLLQLLYEDDE